MLWKILSGLSAVALAVGLWFSYQNQGLLKEELAQKNRADQNLKAVKQAQEEAVAVSARKKKELDDLTKQRDNTEVAKVNAAIAEKQKEVDALKKTLAEAQKQLATMNAEITKAGDVIKLLAQVEDLKKQVKDSEAAIANQEQQLALSQEKVGKITAQIANVKEVDSRQKRGQVEPSFNARVAQPYPSYGFVVLNKGNLGGVFANAMLDVKRGKNVIARLKVRDVEQGMSVADLVPGSLASGEAIRSGDLVVAAPLPPPPPEPAPTAVPPAAEGAAPAGGMAPPAMGAADPFGAPAAPAPAAGTPPPASADPFAPPAGGAMAAPPAGAAPAAGDGTPQKPSTADPFAK